MLRVTFPVAVLSCLVLNCTFPAHAQNQYQGRIDTWVMQDALNPPPDEAILFVGSSSIRYWESLTREFSSYDVIQRGFGGSQFSDLNLFVDEIVVPYDPTAIVVFEGTNDIASGKTAQRVYGDYLNFVDLVQTGQDQTQPPISIFFIGITPTPDRWSLWNIASETNSQIDAYSRANDNLYYIDTPTAFLASSPASGQPPSADLFAADGLHLSRNGYAIWNDAVASALEGASLPSKAFFANPLHPPLGSRILIDFGPSNANDGRHTVSPDENGNHWNNWHPISAIRSGGATILAGESVGNLLTIEGQETGIDLIVTAEFGTEGRRDGGLLAPDAALLGDIAVATATEDYFFAAASRYEPFVGIQTGGLMLTGLDPSLTYDLRFFGTRAASKDWTSGFRIFGAGEPVTASLQTSGVNMGSDGQYDGNDSEVAMVEGLQSDEFGQIFIDVYAEGDHRTHLGVMEINVVPAVGDCNGDSALNAADLSCVSSIEARDVVLEALDTLPGDLDGNGDVAFADFLILSANFGQDLPSYADGNIDLNDGIAFADFLVLSANFGKTPKVVAVIPEPNGLCAVWLGFICLAAVQRHRRFYTIGY